MFNIGPVVIQEDGSVTSLETIRRREERKAATVTGIAETGVTDETAGQDQKNSVGSFTITSVPQPGGIDPTRLAQMNQQIEPAARKMSKTQQKKLASLQPRPPPPKPVIPEGISLPEGEESWLALWDLTDAELERRFARGKKRKAAERKALRVKQQSGKVERRAARDEKRRVYRDLKMTWKVIKGA